MDIRVKLLIQAKALIESGEESCICWALNAAHTKIYGENTVKSTAELHKLHERVMLGLDGCSWLESWLRDQGLSLPNHNQRDLARMAWIDKLIEEYSSCEA